MSRLRFVPDADAAQLPEAWRPLERTLYRWLRQCGASRLTATIASWTSHAESAGHTALDLREPPLVEMHGLDPKAIEALGSDSGFVGDGNGPPTALVLDAAARVSLWRNHVHERTLASALLGRRNPSPLGDDADVEAKLDELFQGRRDNAANKQRQAVAGVLGKRLFVLTGGPGTGKTTTVLRMLLMLQRYRSSPIEVAVSAPTGKAAQRLRQALREGRQSLQSGDPTLGIPPLSADWEASLACLPDGEAVTLHRLLGFEPHADRFARGPQNPISADVVVVDEASMADLRMMRTLLDALRTDALLILVGDADQLTSVAAGSALMDIVGAMEGSAQLVRLQHSFRAEKQLQVINEAIRCGEPVALGQAVDAAGSQARTIVVQDEQALAIEVDAWARHLAVAGHRDESHEAPDQSALAGLRRLGARQLLCALRQGAFGAKAVNSRIESRLRKAWGVAQDAQWYAGRAVLITHNDYETGLFNGDVGLCQVDAAGELRVWFETVLPDGSPGARSIAPALLPEHEGAFAITIHKSQGSEYDHVAVLLPPEAGNRILSRQLLYTGTSRARQSLEIWSSPTSLEACVRTAVRRMGGLAGKLGQWQSE